MEDLQLFKYMLCALVAFFSMEIYASKEVSNTHINQFHTSQLHALTKQDLNRIYDIIIDNECFAKDNVEHYVKKNRAIVSQIDYVIANKYIVVISVIPNETFHAENIFISYNTQSDDSPAVNKLRFIPTETSKLILARDKNNIDFTLNIEAYLKEQFAHCS